MKAKIRSRASKPSRLAAALGKKNGEGWLQLRRASMQPWRRGRVRPSSCHDLNEEA